MNSNCAEIKITPFRLFDSTARNNYKRSIAQKIQNALNSIDISQNQPFESFLEDAAQAQQLLSSQRTVERRWLFISFSAILLQVNKLNFTPI